MSRRAAQAGFTLIEVLIVLLIAGLALGLVLTHGPPRAPGWQSRAAAAEMVQGLRLARARAIATDRPVPFVLDTAARRWRVGDDPAKNLPPAMEATLLTVAGAVSGDRGSIVFAPDGSSSGGRITLSDGITKRTLGVDWLTGRVTAANGA